MGGIGRRLALYFTGRGSVDVREEPVESLSEDKVAVRTLLSAVSAGTERLFFEGRVPAAMPADSVIPALGGCPVYPVKYGYAAVGRVVAAGSPALEAWNGRRVFALHPHETCFTAEPGELVPVPDDIPDDDAVFFPFVETALTLVLDGHPRIGEAIAVLGQGTVGLLTTALLAQFPLSAVITVERSALRRDMSEKLGATAVFASTGEAAASLSGHDGADAVFEVSGAPELLNGAIALAGFAGRVIVGSWYGARTAPLDLGGRFHRDRITITGSQVSTLDPALSGRWTRKRRWDVAIDMVRRVRPSRLISHRFPVHRAEAAYALLSRGAPDALQTVLTYE